MKTRIMLTHFVYPPIPIRTCDWWAGWDDQEGSGYYGPTEREAVQDVLDNTDELMTRVVFSSSWTGREGWRPTTHWGFWNKKTQLPFFMVWRQYYDDNGEVNSAVVLFNSFDWIGF